MTSLDLIFEKVYIIECLYLLKRQSLNEFYKMFKWHLYNVIDGVFPVDDQAEEWKNKKITFEDYIAWKYAEKDEEGE